LGGSNPPNPEREWGYPERRARPMICPPMNSEGAEVDVFPI